MDQKLLEALLKAWKEKSMEPLKDYPEEFAGPIEILQFRWIMTKYKDTMTKEQKQFAMDAFQETVTNLLGEWGFKDVLEGSEIKITVL